ncbi:MAG: HNH endonuclease [Candidatus Methanolliviera sp. GoM_oil]|nr:MAG: HNH endonuclease [Candidatus Methanolliviera sp. GoM_oil]
MAKTIGDLIIEYFKKHPKENLSHGPVVDWVEKEYLKLYGRKPRDTWRQIRKFHQEGILIKVKKGIYKYDPDYTMKIELFDFSPKMKEEIFRQDNYRCVVCERGRQDGVEICADHIKPKDKGGTNTVDNGQTLCMEHNLMKKNYSQTEAGKRYFIKMYEQAVSNNDGRMIDFCKCVFECYDKYGVNGHITRPYSKE